MEKTSKYLSKSGEPISLPSVLPLEGRMFLVLDDIKPDVVFKEGKGYLYDDYVWVFETKKPNSSQFPYFWYEHGKIIFGKIRPELKESFKASNCVNLSYINMVNTTNPNKELYDEDVYAAMNAATTIFKPIINEKEDDPLKKLIKTAILSKDVNIRKYTTKFDKPYELSNKITTLTGKTAISIKNWIIFMDMLGLKYEVKISDSGFDPSDPLRKPLIYKSETDKIYEQDESGELTEINLSQFTREN